MRELEYPFDALISYHYFRNDDTMTAIVREDRLRLIADSGAFSAFTQGSEIKLEEYAAWLHRWRPHLFWCASLDVFGDPEATFANWRLLRDRHQLDTVPTLHIGSELRWIDVYAAEGVDFMGLGGMVGASRPEVLRWLVHTLRYARDRHPAMRFHAWGTTAHSLIAKLPLYSADSSGLLGQAYRYARLELWDSKRRATVAFPLDGREPLRHRRLLHEQYGVNVAEVLRSHRGNRQLLIHLAAMAVQHRAAALQAIHRVPPPTWGIATDLVGPRLHPAEAKPTDFPSRPGPRLHVTDANHERLVMLAQKGPE